MINEHKNRFSTKSSVLALAVATSALSFGVVADDAIGATAEETVRIEANIPTMCQFDENFGQINISNFVDGKPAGSNSAEQATAVVTCNEIADVELESTHGGMVHHGVHIAPTGAPTHEAPLGGDYLTQFDYVATLEDENGDPVVEVDTANASGPTSVQSAFGGVMPTAQQLTLEIVPEDVAGVLQAGLYRDDLVVRIIPQE